MLSVTNKPIMLNVVILSVVMLSIIMLSATMLSVVMLNVLEPGSCSLQMLCLEISICE